MKQQAQFINGRVVGGCSIHAEHKPELCVPGRCQRSEARCVDCCKLKPDMDVNECARCGLQFWASCNFDEDFA